VGRGHGVRIHPVPGRNGKETLTRWIVKKLIYHPPRHFSSWVLQSSVVPMEHKREFSAGSELEEDEEVIDSQRTEHVKLYIGKIFVYKLSCTLTVNLPY
jgi:hypothetical protein